MRLLLIFLWKMLCGPDYSLSDNGLILYIKGEGEILQDEVRIKCDYDSIKSVYGIDVTNISSSAFSGCVSLEFAEFTDSLIYIGPSAFAECVLLREFRIPDKIVHIFDKTFYSCKSLQKLHIPASLKDIEFSYAFYQCRSLFEFNVSLDSATFSTDSSYHYLMNADKSILYHGPGNADNLIPPSVKVIAPYYANSLSFKKLEFPQNSLLEKISEYAFRQISLISIIFPPRLKHIDYAIFYQGSCGSLTFPNSLEFFHSGALFECNGVQSFCFDNESSKCFLLRNNVVYDRNSTMIYFVSPEAIEIFIPQNVTNIDGSLIRSPNIQRVSVDPNNEVYSEINNILYTNKNKTLVAAPGSLIFANVTSTCTYVMRGAFQGCSVEAVRFAETGLTKISDVAFYYCNNLTTINFPRTLTAIGYSCFVHTSLIGEIILPASLTDLFQNAFEKCSKISSRDLSHCDKLTTLKQQTFMGCSAHEIKLPSSIENLESEVFRDMENISSVSFTSNLSSISSKIFKNCFNLETVDLKNTHITVISDLMFECSGIKSIKIPDTVESINTGAFQGCKRLQRIEFGADSRLNTIASDFISGCESLENIEIPKGVLTISPTCFANSIGLKNITVSKENPCFADVDGVLMIKTEKNNQYILRAFPGGRMSGTIGGEVEGIYPYAFYQCSKLETLVFSKSSGENIKEIPPNVFNGCSKLSSLQLPDGIENIDQSAFNGCSSITSISFGGNSSLKSIGNMAFVGCKKLASFDFPLSLMTIGESAFEGCSKLEKINLVNVTHIGNKAFYGCSKIPSVILTKSLISLGENSFVGCINISNVKYCGSLDFQSPVFGSAIKFVHVPIDYLYPRFCGVECHRVLDHECNIPTHRFTACEVNSAPLIFFIPLVGDEQCIEENNKEIAVFLKRL